MAGAPTDKSLRPKRKLGLAMCIALVVGNMIGAGVFLLPASLAPLGWNSVYGWLVTIAGSLCLVAVLNRLARGRADSCAAYSYPAAAFGPGTGFIVAWSYWISTWVTNATLAIAAISNLSVIWPGLAGPGVPAAGAIGLVWLFTLVNCLGVRAAGEVQLVTTVLKLLPLAGAILVGGWLLAGSSTAVAPHDTVPIGVAGVSAAATLTLFAMLGFESAAAAGDRVENPERIVPRATLIGALIAGFFYLLACSAVTLMLPAAVIQDSNAPFATFFATLVNPALGPIVAIFVAIAALGALNGFVLLQAEMPLALARAGLLPAWTARFNRNEIPYRIHIISSGLATLVVLANYSRGLANLFQFMVLVTTSTAIILYFACAAASLKLAREGEVSASPGFISVAVAAFAYSAWAFSGAGIEAGLWGLAMTAVGLPVYLVMRRTVRSSAPAATPAASPGSAA
ncbi:amino acid permease [Sphingosinicella sp.]|uniref:amino acid permease n=1 Tax=Sphingosinicella sp. TaxID=1917971 RepID=UPI0040382D9B